MTTLFSFLTIIAQVSIVFILLSFAIIGINYTRERRDRSIKRKNILSFFSKHGVLVAFIIALVSTLGSLYYSEIAHLEPCKLCWFQRILMYPQTIILGTALWKKGKGVLLPALIMSLIGALIALYHYLLQLGVAPQITCSTVGYSVDCSQRFILQFGYITIPMMSFTAFLFITILLGIQTGLLRKQK